ncbi:hypothetical protein [Methylobacterium fujisawaense]
MPLLLPDGSLDDCVIGIVQSHMMFPDDQASIEDDIGAYRMRSQTGFRKSQLGRQMDANFRNAELGGFYAGGLIYKLLGNYPRGGSVGGGTPAAAPLAGTSLPLARVGFR